MQVQGVNVGHIQYWHFTGALQSDMSLQDCIAVKMDGATTKMGREKTCCKNMSHELIRTCEMCSLHMAQHTMHGFHIHCRFGSLPTILGGKAK